MGTRRLVIPTDKIDEVLEFLLSQDDIPEYSNYRNVKGDYNLTICCTLECILEICRIAGIETLN